MAILSVGILFKQPYYIFGIGFHVGFVTVIPVDYDEYMSGADVDFRTFVIACWCTYSANQVTVYRQVGNVDGAAAYAFIRLAFFPDAECQRVAGQLVSIEAAYAVTVSYACKVD